MRIGFFARAVQYLLVGSVQCYRLFFRAWIGSVCRFEPSCSTYAVEALTMHGPAAGSYLTLRRLVRCQPWCDGGHDPVPTNRSGHGLFARFTYCESSTADKPANEISFDSPRKVAVMPTLRATHFSEKLPP